jgi:SAM-dependent methyltransferase
MDIGSIIRRLYSTDLAFIHDAGFGDFAEGAAPEVIRILGRQGVHPPAARGAKDRPRSRRKAPRVVDVGCGSGILARHLVDARYTVVGFDISPAMIRLARVKVPEARFRVAPLTEARLPRCAAVVAIGEVVSYVAATGRGAGPPPAIRTFFSRVHEALTPGGVFVFDFIESGGQRTYSAKVHSGDDWVIAVHAELDRAKRILTRRIVTIRKLGRQYRRTQETHRQWVYNRRAVAKALADAGFAASMSRSYGRYRLIAGDVAVVATKPDSGRTKDQGPRTS